MLHQLKLLRQHLAAHKCETQYSQKKKKNCHTILWLYVREMLRKEIRAVKLVFLQRVKEVTTDGADAVRQPTDIQY